MDAWFLVWELPGMNESAGEIHLPGKGSGGEASGRY